MNTNIADPDVSLVIEFLLVVKEPNEFDKDEKVEKIEVEAPKFKDYKRFGIGFAVLPIFNDSLQKSVKMLQGTAR